MLIVAFGCKKNENPYVGYIIVERAVVEAGGGSATVTADTDISSPIEVTVPEGVDWVSVSTNGREITATATQPNTGTSFRTATIGIRCGYRTTSFTVLQKYEGQKYLQYDWTGWTATGNSVQAGDGGGYPSLFTDSQTTFWHSSYSAGAPPLPYYIVIDMKKELDVAMVSIGRRYYAGNGNYYGTFKTLEIYAGDSPNADEITDKIGEINFNLPWTAPDGTVVTSATNPNIPPFEDVVLPEITTARYVKLVVTASNMSNNTAQIAFFKAYESI